MERDFLGNQKTKVPDSREETKQASMPLTLLENPDINAATHLQRRPLEILAAQTIPHFQHRPLIFPRQVLSLEMATPKKQIK